MKSIADCELLLMMTGSFDETHGQCFNFSKEIAEAILDIKVTLSSIDILLSLFAIGLIVRLKFYKKFVYRLVMYLMAVNIMKALCMIINIIPVEVTDDCAIIKNGTGWTELCAAIGYLDIVAAWMNHFVIIWIMLYMLKLSWQLQCLPSNQQATPPSKKSHTREIIGVVFLVVSPFLFCWIPFVKNMYGISGLWCFIKTKCDSHNGCKDFQHLSLTLMMIMFYGPLIGIFIFGLICLVIILILLQKSSTHLHGAVRQRYRSSMKEIGLVLIYPIVYCLFCFFPLVNRIYSTTHTNTDSNDNYPQNYPLWVIQAVAGPGRIMIPALAFLLHPHVWKKIVASRTSSQNSITEYSVPPEDDDISEGYTIRPSNTTNALYGSTNSNVLFLTVTGKGN